MVTCYGTAVVGLFVDWYLNDDCHFKTHCGVYNNRLELTWFDKVQADGIERCIPLSFGAINRKFDEKIF